MQSMQSMQSYQPMQPMQPMQSYQPMQKATTPANPKLQDVKIGIGVSFIIIAIWWIYVMSVYKISQQRLDGIAIKAYSTYNSNVILDQGIDLSKYTDKTKPNVIDVKYVIFNTSGYYITLTSTDNNGISTDYHTLVQVDNKKIMPPPIKLSSLEPMINIFIKNKMKSPVILTIPDEFLPKQEENRTAWDAQETKIVGDKLQSKIYLINALTLSKILYSNVEYDIVSTCKDGETGCVEL